MHVFLSDKLHLPVALCMPANGLLAGQNFTVRKLLSHIKNLWKVLGHI